MISDLEFSNALCRENFDAFAQRAFAEIEPGIPYEFSWHIECFPYEQPILTDRGYMPIGYVVESGFDGLVLSYNHKTNTTEWKKVTARMKKDGQPLYDLICNRGEQISLTANHPVWCNNEYIEASKIKDGDSILRILPQSIYETPLVEDSLLRDGMFWKGKNNTKEHSLPRLRWAKDVFNGSLPAMLSKITQNKIATFMCGMWDRCRKMPLEYCWESLLQQKMSVCASQGFKEPKLCGRKIPAGIPENIQINKKENYVKRWLCLFYMQTKAKEGIGGSSYRQRQRQKQQSNMEFGNSLSSMSQQTKVWANKDIRVGECYVRSIKQSIRIPRSVYNIEVADNNNYFADGILVHNCICWHLQALFEGTLPGNKRRLCINVPPRSLKSYLASIAYPAWVLGKKPNEKFIATSFNATLAKEMSQKSRILIESDWYKQLFPKMRIDDNQNEKHNYWSTERGMYYSSALMSVTGRGAGTVILDDPISPKEAISDTIRQDTNATIRSTIPTRFNDLRDDKWLLIMQRIHEDDPTGHFALKDPRWFILKLPGENKTGKSITYELNGKSWTMQPDELLFPNRLTRQVLDDLRTDLDDYNYAGQILQEPVPIGGGDFRQEWIQYYHQGACKPKEMNIVILVDPAGGDDLNKKKRKLSDWTAMMVVGFAPDNNKYLLDIVRDKLNPTDRVNTLFMLHKKWNALTGKSPKVGYEKYGMMSDTHYIDEKKKQDAYNFPLIILGGTMSKEERIKQLIPDLQNGRLFFPQSLIYVDGEGRRFDLVSEIINGEMPSFPRARHDDMLDALSRMYEPDLCMVFPKPKVGMIAKARANAYEDNSQSWENF